MTNATAPTSDAAVLDFLGDLSEQHGQPTKGRRRGMSAQDRFFKARQRQSNFYAGFSTDQISGGGSGGFEAGRISRMTDGWTPQQMGPNRLTAQGGRIMRNRARDLVNNNPLAFSGVIKFINNVVGCGTAPKPQFDDRDARQLWISHWEKWCGHTAHATRECDLTGDQPFAELMTLWLTEIIVGGGCLVRFVELPRRGRSIPLAIELIPEERFADHLQQSGPNAKTANPIEQGIEFDAHTGQVLAYHVLPFLPNDSTGHEREPIRIPREQAEYAFFKRRAGQRRGWTLMAPAIQWLFALGYYTDSELFASDAKASWAYMITTGEGADIDWGDLVDSDTDSGTLDIHGNTVEKLEPGSIFRGFPGDKISAVGPNVPGSDSLPWLQLIQRSIAAGMEQSYEEITGDYSLGNMASIRMAAESVRKGYRRMHKHLIHHLANPTYRRWAEHATRAGLDGFPRPSEFVANDDWLRVKWSSPSWSSPNPMHDANAAKTRKEIGIASDRDLIEERGGDVDELYDELEFEQQERERRGLLPALSAAPAAGMAALLPGDNENDPPEAGDA